MAAVGALTGGFLPTLLMRRGVSLNGARKGSMLLYACIITCVPLVLLVDSPWHAAMLLGLGLFAHQGFSTNVFAFTTDVFPARMVGTAIGIAAFAGNLSGMGMIEFAGWSLDTAAVMPRCCSSARLLSRRLARGASAGAADRGGGERRRRRSRTGALTISPPRGPQARFPAHRASR
jgi:nitrate/nitrite transporter NarK